ncbi:MAG: DivIVA domain-containing protein [Candidatus Nanopelagicales bacterium]
MTLAFVLAGIAVIAAVALLAVGRLGELPEAEPDRAPLALPEDRPLDREDVDSVRFAVGVRGYRMDEVDDVLDRLAVEVAERDARIDELEARLASRGVPRPMPEADDAP